MPRPRYESCCRLAAVRGEVSRWPSTEPDESWRCRASKSRRGRTASVSVRSVGSSSSKVVLCSGPGEWWSDSSEVPPPEASFSGDSPRPEARDRERAEFSESWSPRWERAEDRNLLE